MDIQQYIDGHSILGRLVDSDIPDGIRTQLVAKYGEPISAGHMSETFYFVVDSDAYENA